jgi:hypothetical protein
MPHRKERKTVKNETRKVLKNMKANGISASSCFARRAARDKEEALRREDQEMRAHNRARRWERTHCCGCGRWVPPAHRAEVDGDTGMVPILCRRCRRDYEPTDDGGVGSRE